jgi:hypothetical protein
MMMVFALFLLEKTRSGSRENLFLFDFMFANKFKHFLVERLVY